MSRAFESNKDAVGGGGGGGRRLGWLFLIWPRRVCATQQGMGQGFDSLACSGYSDGGDGEKKVSPLSIFAPHSTI